MDAKYNMNLLAYYYDPEAKHQLPTDSIGNYKVEFDPSIKPIAGISSAYATIYTKSASLPNGANTKDYRQRLANYRMATILRT